MKSFSTVNIVRNRTKEIENNKVLNRILPDNTFYKYLVVIFHCPSIEGIRPIRVYRYYSGYTFIIYILFNIIYEGLFLIYDT